MQGDDYKEFQGRIQRIVFRAADSNFTIASFLGNFKGEPDFLKLPVSAKGNMIEPQQGVEYRLQLKEEPANKYGQQFSIISYETLIPVDPRGIFKYITNVCKYVGPTIGSNLVDRYGVETIQIMKTDPERIAKEIPGLTLERAKEIQDQLIKNERSEKIMIELEGLLDIPGMRKDSIISALIGEYKEKAAEVLRADPYIITQYQGVGFLSADQLAIQKLKYDASGEKRIRAALFHFIKKAMQDTGSTWIPERTIEAEFSNLTPRVKRERIVSELTELEEAGQIHGETVFLDGIKNRLFALHGVYAAEIEVAEKINNIMRLQGI